MGQARFLFLQGMASWFFDHLGRELLARGHEVRRINMNGGDRLFWNCTPASDFRDGLKRWPAFLERHLEQWEITDVVLFGDCRPLHKVARKLARARDLRVHVVEEGYLRPNWVTLEQGGCNGYSSLRRDPTWVREAAGAAPPWTDGERVVSRFSRRAFEDVCYNVASMAMSPLYPGYRTHRPWHPAVEYAGWLSRFAVSPIDKRVSRNRLEALLASDTSFWVFPLQLDCDSQVREHSWLGRLAPAIEQVISSFAHRAPLSDKLVLKEHPLDNRLQDWNAVARRAAMREGVQDRVVYLPDSKIEPLYERAKGVVTINSTAGFLALRYGLPVMALGPAIYNMPTLTFQGGLDDFWTQAASPSFETFDAFRRVVAQRTQVNGGFYSKDALKLAVQNAADRLDQATDLRDVASQWSTQVGAEPNVEAPSLTLTS
ncbi:capsule biosynthesis protein [Caulobacter sp. S45]|uniref:capsule biosynthesis protein n=1 Tax=Caulobacter sp. S45 TaxID=1641861 RepID=UPI001574FF51|nr:capsular biosynthesis protein [Caulobacter sp. S45]